MAPPNSNACINDNKTTSNMAPQAKDDGTANAVTEVAEEETPEQREQRILTHRLLARQLEYYFSTANLSKDTYLSTLRELNEGYVPLSIIANFGKVQALAPYESALTAVRTAANDHSDLLETVELKEGKKILRDSNSKEETVEIGRAHV